MAADLSPAEKETLEALLQVKFGSIKLVLTPILCRTKIFLPKMLQKIINNRSSTIHVLCAVAGHYINRSMATSRVGFINYCMLRHIVFIFYFLSVLFKGLLITHSF